MGDWKIRDYTTGSFLDMQLDFGFIVQQMPGVGMPPVDNIETSYGLLDGALFQRTRSDVRTFSLVGTLSGSDTADLLAKRTALINQVRPDRVSPQESVILQYSGGGVTKQASVIYDGGLEVGEVSVYTEQKMALRFKQYDPYWETSGSAGATSTSCDLTPNTTLASANFFTFRSASGDWSRVEGASPMLEGIYATSDASGTYWLGLDRTFVQGANGNLVMKWGGAGTVASGFGASTVAPTGGAAANVREILFDSNDGAYMLGEFNNFAGSGYLTTGGASNLANGFVGNIVYWDKTNFFPMDGGVRYIPTASAGDASTLVVSTTGVLFGGDYLDDGKLIVGGTFDRAGSAASVTACGVAAWNKSASTWSALYGGMVNSTAVYINPNATVSGVATDSNGTTYAVGRFTVVSSSVAASRITKLSPNPTTWETVGLGFNGPALDVAIKPDNTALIAGCFTATGDNSQSMRQAALWTGTKLVNLSSSTGGTASAFLEAVGVDQDGIAYFGGNGVTDINGITLSDPLASYSENIWSHLDGLELAGTPRIRWVHASASNTLLVCHNATGDALVAAKTVITNSGNSDAFPVVTVTGSGAFTHLKNFTTGEAIYFGLSMDAGEVITIDLRQGAKTMVSTSKGNIIGKVLPGSNFATFHLQPGANNVSFFHNNTTASVTMTWNNRYWGL